MRELGGAGPAIRLIDDSELLDFSTCQLLAS
jgi:hypothetical protein